VKLWIPFPALERRREGGRREEGRRRRGETQTLFHKDLSTNLFYTKKRKKFICTTILSIQIDHFVVVN
jgi:hypothetical protein